jgi:hypothetical protein
MLFRSGCDGSGVLELVEEALDQVEIMIEDRAEGRNVTRSHRLDVGPGTQFGQRAAERVAEIGRSAKRTWPATIPSSMSAALLPR